MLKSEIISNTYENSAEYPFLGECIGSEMKFTVLFTDYKIGVVVATDEKCWQLGEYSDEWEMGGFIPANYSVTLSNG
jgi:hypothetical protein